MSKKMVFGVVVIILILTGLYLVLINRSDKKETSSNIFDFSLTDSFSTDSELGVGPGSPDNQVKSNNNSTSVLDKPLTKVYINPVYKFSFSYPQELEPRIIEQEDFDVILIENKKDSSEGVQIVVSPFLEGSEIDADFIQSQLEDSSIQKLKSVTIGGKAKGIAFISNDPAFNGQSAEVWFSYSGNLYQVSSYLKNTKIIESLLSSWSFSNQSFFRPETAYAGWTAGKTPRSNYLNLVGWWTFDGKNTDWTTNKTSDTALTNHGTMTNMSTTTSPIAGKIGQGLSFDGSDDYVSIGNVSSSVKTISFWMKTTNTTKKIVDLNGTANIEVSSGTITANSFTSPTIYVNGAVSSTVTANSWYHVVITTGTDVNASAVEIGRVSSGYFSGVIDDVRIYNRALTATEAIQLHNTGLAKIDASPTRALTNGLVGYWTFDGKDTPWTSSTAATTLDKSGNGNTGTLNSMAQATSPVAGKIGQGLMFDGSNDYVEMADDADFTLSSGYTISAWQKASDYSTKTRYVISQWGDIGPGNSAWVLYISTAGLVTIGNHDGVQVLGTTIAASNSLQTGVWYHIVGTYSGGTTGTNGRIYINGVLNNSGTLSQIPQNSAYKPTIGTSPFGLDRHFSGILDDVRIYNRALSAAEVTQLYNMGR